MQAVHDQREEGVALSKLGDLARQEGDLATAKTNYTRYLEIMQAVHDQRGEGVALSKLGDLARQEGDLATAKTNYARYLAIMQATISLRSQGIAWFNLAAVQEAEGDLDQAEQCHRQSLAIGLRLQLAPEILPSLRHWGRSCWTSAQSGRRLPVARPGGRVVYAVGAG